MKPTTVYLSALILVLATVSHVHAFYKYDTDSDGNFFGEPSKTDAAINKFNERLDKIADRTTACVAKRFETIKQKQNRRDKGAKKLTKMEEKDLKSKIFKECFQEKFDYAKHEVGGTGSIFDIGDINIFQPNEEI